MSQCLLNHTSSVLTNLYPVIMPRSQNARTEIKKW